MIKYLDLFEKDMKKHNADYFVEQIQLYKMEKQYCIFPQYCFSIKLYDSIGSNEKSTCVLHIVASLPWK